MLRQLVAIASSQQLVACAWDGKKFCARGDELHRGLQLAGCGEAIACAVNKEAGRVQLGEVRCAQVLRTLWRMQRIGEQQQLVRNAGLCCASMDAMRPP
jgi:hypothetical protein